MSRYYIKPAHLALLPIHGMTEDQLRAAIRRMGELLRAMDPEGNVALTDSAVQAAGMEARAEVLAGITNDDQRVCNACRWYGSERPVCLRARTIRKWTEPDHRPRWCPGFQVRVAEGNG